MRILIVSYPFPPYGGMSQRSMYFANLLAKAGHTVHVLAIDPSTQLPNYDSSLVRLVSPALTVMRTYAGVLHHLRFRFHRILTRTLREAVLGPASVLEWLTYVMPKVVRMHRVHRYDVVYTHGDPFLANLIGYMLKKSFAVPWVMYVGDPRSFGAYSRFRRVSWRLEQVFTRSADRVIVNAEETMQAYFDRFPAINSAKFTVITDGYDSEVYERAGAERSDKFRLLYSGTFYLGAREPRGIFTALRELRDLPLEFVVAGHTSDATYGDLVRAHGIDDIVVFLGHQPHERVRRLQKGAGVLVAIGWTGGFQLPGKVFDYFAAKRPILVISRTLPDVTARLVVQHRRGIACPDEAQEITRAIGHLYQLWRTGRLDTYFDLSLPTEYSWKALSARFENVLADAAARREIRRRG